MDHLGYICPIGPCFIWMKPFSHETTYAIAYVDFIWTVAVDISSMIQPFLGSQGGPLPDSGDVTVVYCCFVELGYVYISIPYMFPYSSVFVCSCVESLTDANSYTWDWVDYKHEDEHEDDFQGKTC